MEKNIISKIFNIKKLAILLLINFIISIIITILNFQSNQIGIFKNFQVNWIYSNCIGFSIYFVLSLLDLIKLNRWLKIISVFLFILLAGVWGSIIGSKVISYIFGYHISLFNFANLSFFMLLSLVFGVSAYAIFILLAKIHARKIQWLQEKQARTEAELLSLRTRINPHFLFNTLNSISGLIYTAPDKADDMLQQLSELLRYTLNAAEISLIDLSNELDVVQNYLEIEKIRFDSRLDFSISNSVENFRLPPLIILTLVENAVKHGISNSIEGGKIILKATIESKNIIISVYNTGAPLSDQHRTGFGLKSLTELLDIHYKGKAKFNLSKSKDGTLAKILIPKETKNEL